MHRLIASVLPVASCIYERTQQNVYARTYQAISVDQVLAFVLDAVGQPLNYDAAPRRPLQTCSSTAVT